MVDGVGSAGPYGDLQQVALGGVAHLQAEDLVVLVEAKRRAVQRGVVGKADAVGGKEAPRPKAQALLRLVPYPVFVGGDLGSFGQGLASNLAVDGPAFGAEGRDEVGVHEEVAGEAAPGIVHVEMGRTQIDSDTDRAEPVAEEAHEELVLAARSRSGPGRNAPRGRELVARQ